VASVAVAFAAYKAGKWLNDKFIKPWVDKGNKEKDKEVQKEFNKTIAVQEQIKSLGIRATIGKKDSLAWKMAQDMKDKEGFLGIGAKKGLTIEEVKKIYAKEIALEKGDVEATKTAAKTKDEKGRVESKLQELDTLQKEGGIFGGESRGWRKTLEEIKNIETTDLRMVVHEAEHRGIDKRDPDLVKALTKELAERTMSKDDAEAKIMSKDEWRTSDKYKEEFYNKDLKRMEGASTAVQEMVYKDYVEEIRGTAGVDLSEEPKPPKITETAIPISPEPSLEKAKKYIGQQSKLWIKYKDIGSDSFGPRKKILDRIGKQLRGPNRDAILLALKGTALEKAVKKTAGGLKGPADLSGPEFSKFKTKSGGLDMAKAASTVFATNVSGGADQKMETFNNVMKQNQDAKAQQASSSPIIIGGSTTNNASTKSDLNTFAQAGAHPNKTIVTSMVSGK